MKIFGGEMITRVYETLGADENMPIDAKIISNAVESAQKKVEGRNFSIRKNVLQYDDVMNVQRGIIYDERRKVLDGENLKDYIQKMITSVVEQISSDYLYDVENVNTEAFMQDVKVNLGIDELDSIKKGKTNASDIISELKDRAVEVYKDKEAAIGETNLRELERVILLKIVDERWMNHIDEMDELKNGIGLRAYGQKDPVYQYRIEGMDMFEAMITSIKMDVVKFLMNAQKTESTKQRTTTIKITNESLDDSLVSDNKVNEPPRKSSNNTPVVNNQPKVGRNDPCICRKREEV